MDMGRKCCNLQNTCGVSIWIARYQFTVACSLSICVRSLNIALAALAQSAQLCLINIDMAMDISRKCSKLQNSFGVSISIACYEFTAARSLLHWHLLLNLLCFDLLILMWQWISAESAGTSRIVLEFQSELLAMNLRLLACSCTGSSCSICSALAYWSWCGNGYSSGVLQPPE